MEDKIIEALADAFWYNGYEEEIQEWREEMRKEREQYNSVQCPFVSEDFSWWNMSKDDLYGYAQLQILWMLLVLLFGDYGTSPRYGWIEKTKECGAFLDRMISFIDEKIGDDDADE